MDLEKEIKKILIDKEMTVTDLAGLIGTTRQNLNNKLKRKDMKVSEFANILNLLGYKLNICKNDLELNRDYVHKKAKDLMNME